MRAAVLLLLCVPLAVLPAPPEISGCPVLPSDNIWNTPVDFLPVHPQSAVWVSTIGASKTAHADFGSGLWEGGPIGIPFTTVPRDQPRVPVSFYYPVESDPGPYPIPSDAPIEGGPQSTGDRHVLVLDRDNCVLYELFDAHPRPGGSWRAGSGAVFDLQSHRLRPETWTSADAAGLPILPGLVRYEEVAAGEIAHAIRFTVPETRRAYVWPGRHFASSLTGTEYPPMGARFRLRADFDVTGFSSEIQVILKALKKYGMILADNGSPWFLSGVPDERWNNDHLHELRRLRGSDFEAVDASALMIAAASGQARLAGTAAALVNAASFSTGPIAPGEIVSFFGESVGPDPPLALQFGPDGLVTKELGGVTLLFNNVPAPLLYVSPLQINAVVPYAMAGGASPALVQLKRGGVALYEFTLPIIAAAPGIFAVTDPEFRLNSDNNPAAPGSALVLFATGEGQTTPLGIDGKLAAEPLPKPLLLVKVFVASREVELLYVGAAPTLVAGVLQVNIRLPADLAPGRWPLTLRVGPYDSPPGPTIIVR